MRQFDAFKCFTRTTTAYCKGRAKSRFVSDQLILAHIENSRLVDSVDFGIVSIIVSPGFNVEFSVKTCAFVEKIVVYVATRGGQNIPNLVFFVQHLERVLEGTIIILYVGSCYIYLFIKDTSRI